MDHPNSIGTRLCNSIETQSWGLFDFFTQTERRVYTSMQLFFQSKQQIKALI